jgi:anti-sigma factor RsiW
MTQDAPITELDLLAYADGRLEPQRARQVEAALAEDPALRAKVDDFARQNAELAAQFDAYAEAPLPDRTADMLRSEPRTPGSPRRWIGQAAAAAVVALVAGAGGWWLGNGGAKDDARAQFLTTVAELRARTSDTAEGGDAKRVAAGQSRQAIRWFSEQVSLELAVPDLQDKGFALVDKRRVELGASRGVRLRYRAEDGSSFDVFLKSRWRRREEAVSTMHRDNTALAHWLEGPLSVVVAAPSNNGTDVGAIARTLRERMRRTNKDSAPDLEPHGTDAPAQATATRSRELKPTSRPDRMLDAPASPDLLQPATDGGR